MFISILLVNIGPRSGGGAGKKASYGSGKQTLRLKSNGTASVEEVDNVRTTAEENINLLLENFMGINDADLGIYIHYSLQYQNEPSTTYYYFSFTNLGPGR